MSKIEIKIDGVSTWAKEVNSNFELFSDGQLVFFESYKGLYLGMPQGAMILNSPSVLVRNGYTVKGKGEFLDVEMGTVMNFVMDPSISPKATVGTFAVVCSNRQGKIRVVKSVIGGGKVLKYVSHMVDYKDVSTSNDFQNKLYIYEIVNDEKTNMNVYCQLR